MEHNENTQTLKAISKHLKMEKGCTKAYAPTNVACVAKGSGPTHNGPYHGKKSKKGPRPPQNSCSKGRFSQRHKAKGSREENITRVKCYNCGKKRHVAQDCPELAKVLLSCKTPELCVCFHAPIPNSLPHWIIDVGKPST